MTEKRVASAITACKGTLVVWTLSCGVHLQYLCMERATQSSSRLHQHFRVEGTRPPSLHHLRRNPCRPQPSSIAFMHGASHLVLPHGNIRLIFPSRNRAIHYPETLLPPHPQPHLEGCSSPAPLHREPSVKHPCCAEARHGDWKNDSTISIISLTTQVLPIAPFTSCTVAALSSPVAELESLAP
ncbi:unnamed protein product [Victoria cruziana]